MNRSTAMLFNRALWGVTFSLYLAPPLLQQYFVRVHHRILFESSTVLELAYLVYFFLVFPLLDLARGRASWYRLFGKALDGDWYEKAMALDYKFFLKRYLAVWAFLIFIYIIGHMYNRFYRYPLS